MINAMTILSLSARAYASTANSALNAVAGNCQQQIQNDDVNAPTKPDLKGDKDIWINNFKATQALMESKNANSAYNKNDIYKDIN